MNGPLKKVKIMMGGFDENLMKNWDIFLRFQSGWGRDFSKKKQGKSKPGNLEMFQENKTLTMKLTKDVTNSKFQKISKYPKKYEKSSIKWLVTENPTEKESSVLQIMSTTGNKWMSPIQSTLLVRSILACNSILHKDDSCLSVRIF